MAHVLALDAARAHSHYDRARRWRSGNRSKFTIFEPPPIRKFDPSFNADTETYEGTQTFLARIELKKDLKPGPVTITLEPRYQTCSGTSCIPPRTRDVSATLNIDPSAPRRPQSPSQRAMLKGNQRPPRQSPAGRILQPAQPKADSPLSWPSPSASVSPLSSLPASSP